MKTVYPIIALAGALFCNSLAFAVEPAIFAPVEVTVNGVGQDLIDQQVSAKTNIVGIKTNFTYQLKSTATNFTVNAASLLALLTNSLRTNFPAGTKLLLAGTGGPSYSFAVSDSTGTNYSFVPTSVLNTAPLAESSIAFSDIENESSTNNSFFTGNETASLSSVLSFTYDDTAIATTGDGTHTKFTWTGLAQTKYSQNLASHFTTENVTINIIGSGSIRGVPGAVFTGTVRSKLSGLAIGE